VANGKIYAAGVSGVLSCLDAESGKLLWRTTSREAPPYGGPASPLIADDLCIVHVGCDNRGDRDGLTAFDAATGAVRWRIADGSRPGCGSPIVVDLAGQRQIVLLTSWNLRGISLKGKPLWAVRLDGSEKNSTPLLYKDLIIFSDYRERPRAIRLEKGEKEIIPKQVWKGEGPTPYMSTPLLEGDLLFGSSARGRGCLFCMDARNGKTCWESDEQKDFGYATVVNARTVLVFLTVNGRLVVVKPNGKRYEPIAEYRVSDRQTWAYPIFLGDRILIRDDTTLRSYRIETEPRKP
jgi:outer membrane protein assembly factor BamB